MVMDPGPTRSEVSPAAGDVSHRPTAPADAAAMPSGMSTFEVVAKVVISSWSARSLLLHTWLGQRSSRSLMRASASPPVTLPVIRLAAPKPTPIQEIAATNALFHAAKS